MKNNNFDIIEALWLRRERKKRAQKIIEGAPPLTYTAKNAGTLKNYRIYGQTVDGESVGDLVTSGEHAGEYKVPVTVEGKNLFDKELVNNTHLDANGLPVQTAGRVAITTPISINTDTYCLSFASGASITVDNMWFMYSVFNESTLIRRVAGKQTGDTIDASNGNLLYVAFYGIRPQNISSSDISNIMLNEGSTPLPYEPYHTPVTTPIYLPEQIRKVGDEADYIDFKEQKQHFADGTFVDVTLPALPTIAGTNTLTVGTQVQPSKVMAKGKLKE